KDIDNVLGSIYEADYVTVPAAAEKAQKYFSPDEIKKTIKELEKKMKEAAANLEFEEAARIRDEIKELREEELEIL
ncbi:MAG: excinuclease ABC subunit B, partial [Desulfatiglans sp.]|nr:excinuclease ABC subunit B [Desulfatiglans sp.]